ncbi:hypothetical protein F442_14678 [Phytophthora nicotianae P10297]|uniref:Uncharacterized protein n=1 Tax=Phytophthora nicotianae P10297 TaxID=1317064 RepID=W2YRC9_PHYNI|nr:hypothetical protein F442_14678 [Phytophthora nicotianae P10297]
MATSTTVSKSNSETLEAGVARRHVFRVVRRGWSDPDWRYKVDKSSISATMRYDCAFL